MEIYTPDYDFYYERRGSRYRGWCPTCNHEEWRGTVYGITRAMEAHHMDTHTGRKRTPIARKPLPAEPEY